MRCPRCFADEQAGAAHPFRGAMPVGGAVDLQLEPHWSGAMITRCGSCKGAFVEYDAMKHIENAAREKKRHKSSAMAADARMRRGYDPPTAAITCPSCSGETTKREWSIGTMVFVDVCIECRGVWLDSGELETLGG